MTSPTISGTARSAPAAPRIHAHTMTAMKTTSGLRLSSLPMATGWRNWSWAKLMRA
jgi:hypothetical protein